MTNLHLLFPFPYSNNVPLTGRMPEFSGHVLMERFTSISGPIRHFPEFLNIEYISILNE